MPGTLSTFKQESAKQQNVLELCASPKIAVATAECSKDFFELKRSGINPVVERTYFFIEITQQKSGT